MIEGEAALVREQLGTTLLLRINRPEASNALTPDLMEEIGSAVFAAESDPAIRAVVVTGTGERAFCAGMDLRSYASGASGERAAAAKPADEQISEYMRIIRGDGRIPLIGAANGTAVAGGFELLLACDVVVAAAGARFGLSEVKRGLIPGGNGTFLGHRIPFAIAMEMNLTGDPVDAARAYELGLVNAVVPTPDVLPTALALAERIAANAPLAVSAAKELVHAAVLDPSRAWRRLAELRVEVFASEDAKEGARAFLEKREPRWQGR